MEEGASDVSDCAVAQPTVLVLGSEGFGLRTNTRRACTAAVSIPRKLTRRMLWKSDSTYVSLSQVCTSVFCRLKTMFGMVCSSVAGKGQFSCR